MPPAKSQKPGRLANVPTARVRRNPDNPRLIFRSEELEELASSIQEIGVQVPINVYRDGRYFILIDGERRWRACRKLNLDNIPAIVLPKPSQLQNIVYMFNIHRYRKDWDPLPTAMKLEELSDLIERDRGTAPNESELASLTGMSRGAVRRCKLIMEIPKADRRLLLEELEKPPNERRFTTDLYVECQRSVRTIRSYCPALKDLEKPLRNALIAKYKSGVIRNLVHMRQVASIIRAADKGVSLRTVERILRRLIEVPDFAPPDGYAQIAWVYDVRSIRMQAESLASLIDSMPENLTDLDKESQTLLRRLATKITNLLNR
jgi:ParB family chromosome partitioning protein